MTKKYSKIIFIFLIFFGLGSFFLFGLSRVYSFYLSAPSNDGTKQVFVIKKGERVISIVERLEKGGLIRSGLVFKIYLRFHGLEKNLQSGDFKLSKSFSAPKLIEELAHGVVDKWVTTIEGLRNEEIAQVLNKELGLPKEEFLSQANQGYMFPDTYLIPKDASSAAVIKIMRDNFEKKFSPELESQVAKTSLSKEQVINLASVVEREARNEGQRSIIAGILLKRLKADMPLEADVTVQYALGYQQNEKTWWKKRLSSEDLKIDSPYNTRVFSGLPPMPICNPGLNSIKAVLNYQETPYWYYFHDKGGNIYYSKTLEEHNEKQSRLTE